MDMIKSVIFGSMCLRVIIVNVLVIPPSFHLFVRQHDVAELMSNNQTARVKPKYTAVRTVRGHLVDSGPKSLFASVEGRCILLHVDSRITSRYDTKKL